MGKNIVQVQAWLEKYYPESAPSKTTIKRWLADFKRGCTDTDDAQRPSRSNEAVIVENIENTLKIIMGNRQVKLQEIAGILKLSKVSIYIIIHGHLCIKKLFSKWVLRLLTTEQKQQRQDNSKSCLEMFMRNKKDFLRWYMTMDETWIQYFTPESKQQSVKWCADGESQTKI
ncbi:uncharacterized protein [Lepeophtheirus salmonis]|uniref:uncharacterized protein n=1 Tax=Lepeophtheirus salmonis TaxID=72036 RepID=UPI001AE0FD5D|nr:uncharacterized protein LOC121131685 [Lepeophtheirus salmonis]